MKYKLEIKWALIYTVMTLCWMYFEKLMGWHDVNIADHPTHTNFMTIPSMIIFALAFKEKKKNSLNGQITFKQGFIYGVIISIILGVLSPINMYLIANFISPDFFQNAAKYAVDNKLVTLEQANEYFNMKNYIIQGLIGAPFFGIMTSLLFAFLFKSKKS